MEGRPWGGSGHPVVPHCVGWCGAAASCCSLSLLPACASSPAEAPEKKNHCGPTKTDVFFFTDDEMSKWSSMFLFALACHFIHFKLFNHI